MGMSGDTALVLAKSYVKKTLEGQGALKGQDGFSPTVKENPSNTDNDYRLDITDKDGTFTTPNLKEDSNYIAETYATKVQVDELKSDLVNLTNGNNLAILDNFTYGHWYGGYVNNDKHYFRTKGIIAKGKYRFSTGDFNELILISLKDTSPKVVTNGIYDLLESYYLYAGDGETDYSDVTNLTNVINSIEIVDVEYDDKKRDAEIRKLNEKIYGEEIIIPIPKEDYYYVGLLSPYGILSQGFPDYRTTPYIPIDDNIKRLFGVGFPNSSYSCFCTYDESLNFVSTYTGEYDINVDDIPSNVRYFRASISNNSDNPYYCKVGYLSKDDVSMKSVIEELKKEIGYVVYDGDFNYLAIGNSITWHGKTSYWWNECGMASTIANNDYYHRVVNHLSQTKGKVCSYVKNFSIWETQSHDRAETFDTIKHYLSDKLDLVTIQLSENVSDYTTWKSDYIELVNYIKSKAPNAQIIIIGDFWNTVKTDVKTEVAQATNVSIANLNDIVGNTDYECGMGTTVYDEDGNAHTVEHSGVATHPGDSGMEYIANKVIALLN